MTKGFEGFRPSNGSNWGKSSDVLRVQHVMLRPVRNEARVHLHLIDQTGCFLTGSHFSLFLFHFESCTFCDVCSCNNLALTLWHVLNSVCTFKQWLHLKSSDTICQVHTLTVSYQQLECVAYLSSKSLDGCSSNIPVMAYIAIK